MLRFVYCCRYFFVISYLFSGTLLYDQKTYSYKFLSYNKIEGVTKKHSFFLEFRRLNYNNFFTKNETKNVAPNLFEKFEEQFSRLGTRNIFKNSVR